MFFARRLGDVQAVVKQMTLQQLDQLTCTTSVLSASKIDREGDPQTMEDADGAAGDPATGFFDGLSSQITSFEINVRARFGKPTVLLFKGLPCEYQFTVNGQPLQLQCPDDEGKDGEPLYVPLLLQCLDQLAQSLYITCVAGGNTIDGVVLLKKVHSNAALPYCCFVLFCFVCKQKGGHLYIYTYIIVSL